MGNNAASPGQRRRIGGVKSCGRVHGGGATMVAVGEPAPDFALPGDDGRVLSLKDFRGKKAVLYFYPKDDTPGCTKEACSFRANPARVRSKGAGILGASLDASKSRVRFKGKDD